MPSVTLMPPIYRGYAFVGTVGARHRFGYIAFSDVINRAARREGGAKELGAHVIVICEKR